MRCRFVQIAGQQVDEVELVFKQDKIKQLGLSEDTVKNMIKASDVKVTIGLYTLKDTEKSVVVDGNITTIKALEELKIPAIPHHRDGQGSNKEWCQQRHKHHR